MICRIHRKEVKEKRARRGKADASMSSRLPLPEHPVTPGTPNDQIDSGLQPHTRLALRLLCR